MTALNAEQPQNPKGPFKSKLTAELTDAAFIKSFLIHWKEFFLFIIFK